jgi:hypothetical protein
MGPVPLPYPTQTYQTNPIYRMTPQQRYALQQGFVWAQGAFRQNHSICRDRGECLKFDLQSLTNYITAWSRMPATPYFQEIYNVIKNDAMTQKFMSQWVVFQYLSPTRQTEYRTGLRVTPVRPQYVINYAGAATPAFFNQDDVLTDLLQHIDHQHKNCNQYITCRRGDLQIINNFYNRLAVADPVRQTLRTLYNSIANISAKRIFNTTMYLNLYNPMSQSWNDISRKYKARKIGTYGYAEWKQVERSSRATTWRAPRITNGTVIAQNQLGIYSSQLPPGYVPPVTPYVAPATPYVAPPPGSFRSNVEGLRYRSQKESQKVQSWGDRMKDYAWNNKDLLKGWFGKK